jgi:lysophospholipase L1-like esterase
MDTGTAPRRALRMLVRSIAWVALNLLVLEVATRAFFATQVGPRVLLYGTHWQRNTVAAPPTPDNDPLAWSPQSHLNNVGDYRAYTAGATGYSKYFPYEQKLTGNPDGQGQFPVRINNHGLRGEDFTVEKPPGTFRILTLGASSTFGYHDRDDETYPVLLERELAHTGADGRRYEVINFGVPHATTDNTLALFLTEGVPLSPDMVTFYEGANDAAVIESRDGTRSTGWRETLAERFLLGALLDRIVPSTDAADTDWWWSDELAERRSRAFIANLDRLAAECRRRGIRLIVCTQQFKSTLIPPEQLRGLTYDQEVEQVRAKVARGELGPHAVPVSRLAFGTRLHGDDALNIRTLAVGYPPRALLVHTRLMAALRAWVPGAGVGFVDVIHELDAHRDLIVNWVHLRGEANAIIARALAREIRAELAREATAPPADGHS